MDINKKYLRWVDKNITSLDESKTILVIGATGSIGRALSNFLAYERCNIILGGRNSSYLDELKNDLKECYNVDASTLIIDYANIESVNKALETLQKVEKIDCIINNAGIYHQDKKYIDDFELTYLVNYLSPVYFFEHLLKNTKFLNTKIINVGSITYNDHKIDFKDFTGENLKNKTARYSVTKRLLTSYTLYLKTIRNINAYMVHPGVSTTNLFAKKNKAYPKIFYVLAVPIMKVLFMNPTKASLSLLKAIDLKEVKDDEWVGPRGLFKAWGYPNIQKLDKKFLDKDYLNKVKERTDIDLRRLER